MTVFDDPWEWFDPEIGRQNVRLPYKPDAKAFETKRARQMLVTEEFRAASIAANRGWTPLRESVMALLISRFDSHGKTALQNAMRDVAGVERLSDVPEALLPALRLKLTELRK